MARSIKESYPPVLLHELPMRVATVRPDRVAVTAGKIGHSYAALSRALVSIGHGLLCLGLKPGSRVAVFLEKRFEFVVASFGVSTAGGVVVPVNPLLKPAQVLHILRDAGVQVLITSEIRLNGLLPLLHNCSELQHVVLCEDAAPAHVASFMLHAWADLLNSPARPLPQVIETDVAAIFYTSGSTGQPKGVVLSHRNMVAGATSVASYLHNQPDDTLLAVLPLSFDAGFSQLTTAFLTGARVVLLNHLLPRDVLSAMAKERVTGLTAVPALFMQLAALDWPASATQHLRYWACTGGRMPRATLDRLRQVAPAALPFLMYGLTEAFRSTFLPPTEVERRPDSIGKAIPNADIRVLRPDGTECDVDEPGELVHRGPLVALGYWRRPEETAVRFRVFPEGLRTTAREGGRAEIAVFSGDTVRPDAEGFLYFVARQDEMIKTSGYRVSPTEVEEAIHASGLVNEVLAVGVPHAVLGQVILVAAVAARVEDTAGLLAHCRSVLPAYMVPAGVYWHAQALPRNANGKLDRARWKADWEQATGKNNDETL